MLKNIILFIALIVLASSCGASSKEDFEDGVLDDEHRIFTTSQSFTGDLGGVDGADQKCSSLARAAGLSRVYKAVLSSSSTQAVDRIRLDGPIYVFDTQSEKIEIASVVSLWDADDQDLNESISFDEQTNTVISSDIWTGSTSEGTYSNSFNNDCNGWTSSLNSQRGDYGSSSARNGQWLEITNDNCDELKRIYCISQ